MSLLQNFVGKRVNIKASGSAELFTIKSIDAKALTVVAFGENAPDVDRTFKVIDLTTLDTAEAVQENMTTRLLAIEAKLGL